MVGKVYKHSEWWQGDWWCVMICDVATKGKEFAVIKMTHRSEKEKK